MSSDQLSLSVQSLETFPVQVAMPVTVSAVPPGLPGADDDHGGQRHHSRDALQLGAPTDPCPADSPLKKPSMNPPPTVEPRHPTRLRSPHSTPIRSQDTFRGRTPGRAPDARRSTAIHLAGNSWACLRWHTRNRDAKHYCLQIPDGKSTDSHQLGIPAIQRHDHPRRH